MADIHILGVFYNTFNTIVVLVFNEYWNFDKLVEK